MPQKVLEINLEAGLPTVDTALMNMKNTLAACRRRGVRAAVLIHGYGSTGVGGAIRTAVRRELAGPAMRGVVRDVVFGEQWHWRKREMISQCRELAAFEARIAGNEGVTLVLLR